MTAPADARVVRHAAAVTAVRADNPGPLTLTGTQSYVIGVRRVVVLDPGPDDAAHLDRIDAAIDGRPVEAVCLTHAHDDHARSAAAAAARWALRGPQPHRPPGRRDDRSPGEPADRQRGRREERHPGEHQRGRPAGAVIRASAETLARLGVPGEPLSDGSVIQLDDGLALRALSTPGHCADHLAYLLEPDGILFAGDLVLGEGSTMIAHPDGSVQAYLDSLTRLIALKPTLLLPGHGPAAVDPIGRLRACAQHRRDRVAQVRRAQESGARTVAEVREAVYGRLPVSHRTAADMTIRAYLAHLAGSPTA